MAVNPQPTDPLSSNKNPFTATWGEAALAGTPHLLVGLVFALPATLAAIGLSLPTIRINNTGAFLGILDLALFAVLLGSVAYILVVSIRSRKHGLRVGRWRASWYGYGFLMVFVTLLIFLQGWRTPFLDGRLTEAVMYVVLPIALAGFLLWLAGSDPLKSLLAALPATTGFWLQVLEFVPGPARSVVTLGAWLLLSLAAMLIVRFGQARLGTWLAAGANLLVGLAFSAARASFEVLPSGNTYQVVPTRLDLGQFAYYFTPSLLVTSTLLLGPLLVRELWQLGKQGVGSGVWSYRLAVAGLGLALVANLASFWWLTSGRSVSGVETSFADTRLAFAYTVYLGLLLFLAGALYFGAPALRDRPFQGQVVFLLLLAFLLSLPFMAMMPAAFANRFTLPGLPVALYDLGAGLKLLAAVLSLAWVFLASWMAVYLARNEPAAGAP